jgi:hypothetical protein
MKWALILFLQAGAWSSGLEVLDTYKSFKDCNLKALELSASDSSLYRNGAVIAYRENIFKYACAPIPK